MHSLVERKETKETTEAAGRGGTAVWAGTLTAEVLRVVAWIEEPLCADVSAQQWLSQHRVEEGLQDDLALL